MANPMQRRAKNSFLLGFFIALIVMALFVALLINKITSLNETMDEMKQKQKFVVVAAVDIEQGRELTTELVREEEVMTTMDVSNAIKKTDLNQPMVIEDESIENTTGESNNEASEETETSETGLVYKAKIDIPAGSIITLDMLYIEGEEVSDDERIQEYNMISLPSQLENGDYIDIRFKLSTGEDFIVLSKKKVEGTTADTVWLKVDEGEILTLNSAIIEAWMLKGSKLYAIEYTEPGTQKKATQTYPVNGDVLKQIELTPNMLQAAKSELYGRYIVEHRNKLETEIQGVNEKRDELVEDGISAEIQKIQQKRDEYVEALEGTGLIGYSTEE